MPVAPSTTRDPALDTLRGLAIAAMVFGHLAVGIVVPPGAFYIEALGGVAPALFLTISGMMVAHSTWRKGRRAGHFLKRAAIVLAAGALLDVLYWRIWPFTGVDILYLIGVSMPIAWMVARRLPPAGRWIVAAVFLLLAPPLQDTLGYSDYPTEIALDGRPIDVIDLEGIGPVLLENRTAVWQHWIVDGWFPLFPWLGFSLLGVALAGRRWGGRGGGPTDDPEVRAPAGARRSALVDTLLPGLALMVVAVGLGWMDVEWELTPRRRLGGAFMPPRFDYLLGAVGEILTLLWIVDRRPAARVWGPFAGLGSAAFLVYLIHQPAIRIVAWAWGERVSHPVYLLTFVILLAGFVVATPLWKTIVKRMASRRTPTRRGRPLPGGLTVLASRKRVSFPGPISPARPSSWRVHRLRRRGKRRTSTRKMLRRRR